MLERPKPRAGIYEEAFWRFVASREVRLQQCEACRATRYPPGPACPRCGEPAHHWIPISGEGRVVSWTRFHRRYFPALPTPYLCVSVETTEGPLLVGNMVNVDRDPIIGERVELVYEATRTGDDEWVIFQWQPAA